VCASNRQSRCRTKLNQKQVSSPKQVIVQALVLVGGHGTRLGGLTSNFPKPLLDVAGRPFLEYVIDELWRHGFRQVVVLGGHAAYKIEEWAEAFERPGLELEIIIESEPAGTAGALRRAAHLLEQEFFLLNGDSLFDINLLDLATAPFHLDWLAAIALCPMPKASRFGVVELAGQHINNFADRPVRDGPGFVNGGVYRLRRNIVEFIPDRPYSIERELFPELARRGALVGRVYERPMIDIGTHESYRESQKLVPELTRRGAIFFDRDGVLNRDTGYPHRPDQVDWEKGVFEAIKAVNDAGFFAFVITNQAGVARGIYEETDVQHLHCWMNEQLAVHGAHIDEFVYCPYHPTEGHEQYRRESECRKPKPGMILNLLDRWAIDRTRCALIGDKESDLQAAAAAGIPGVLYSGGGLDRTVKGVLTRLSSDRGS
jgi:D,D-heptose 1,7-bisphosphate phosphatase